jgi:hypothetical protein
MIVGMACVEGRHIRKRLIGGDLAHLRRTHSPSNFCNGCQPSQLYSHFAMAPGKTLLL